MNFTHALQLSAILNESIKLFAVLVDSRLAAAALAAGPRHEDHVRGYQPGRQMAHLCFFRQNVQGLDAVRVLKQTFEYAFIHSFARLFGCIYFLPSFQNFLPTHWEKKRSGRKYSQPTHSTHNCCWIEFVLIYKYFYTRQKVNSDEMRSNEALPQILRVHDFLAAHGADALLIRAFLAVVRADLVHLTVAQTALPTHDQHSAKRIIHPY